MRDRRGLAGLVAVLMVLAGCGPQAGGTQAGSPETPTPIEGTASPTQAGTVQGRCSELMTEVEEARAVRSRTFGGGPEGRQATRTIVEIVEADPHCFPEDLVEYAQVMRDILPASPAEEEALAAAEEACEPAVGGSTTSLAGGDDPPLYDTPEAALAAEADTEAGLPDGQRQRSFEQGDRVGFDYRDQGEFTGWVLVERVEEGWFVRRTITCGPDGGVTEQPTHQ